MGREISQEDNWDSPTRYIDVSSQKAFGDLGQNVKDFELPKMEIES